MRTAPKRLGDRKWDPKRYGAVPGVVCGTVFGSRMEASTAAIHAPPVAGISTGKWVGSGTACVSICVSGGRLFHSIPSPFFDLS
jgi:E3 ubiquitin-protein ligase UHRF1